MTMDQKLIQGITEKLKVVEIEITAIESDLQVMRVRTMDRNRTLAELQQLKNTLAETLKTMETLVAA